MPGPKFNRELIVADYLQLRAKDPTYSLRKYCQVKGYSYKYLHRICGRQVVEAWDRITAEVREAYEKRTGSTLVSTLDEMAKAHRALFGQTMNRLISSKRDAQGNPVDPQFTPDSYKDAVMAAGMASSGFVQVAQTLTGKQPMLPPEDIEFETEWVEPLKRRVKPFKAEKVKGNGKGNGRVKGNGKVHSRK